MNEQILSLQSVRGLKRRIMALVTTGTLIVASAFGFSFYFALVSSQTAIVGKVPELESVMMALRRILIFNTLAVAAVLIGSFALLSLLMTTRMLRPLESLLYDLRTLSDGTLPHERHPASEEPFAGFDALFGTVLTVLHSREEKQIEEIRRCLTILTDHSGDERVKAALEEILREKGTFLGVPADAPRGSAARDESDLFLQPL